MRGVRRALLAPWRALSAGPARARVVFSPWRAARRREWWRFPLWCVGRSLAVVEGLLTDVGLGVLGWGFSTRGGVRFVEWTSHGGSRLTALDAHVFEGGPSVLRWVHGVCFSLWWRGFVGGSLYLYDVEGSTRRCWTGSLVGGPRLRKSFASSVTF